MKHKVQHHILVPINGCNGYDSGSDSSCSGSPRLSQRRHSSTSLPQSGAEGGDAGTGVGVGIVRRLRIKSRTGAFRRCHYSSSAFVLFLLIYTFGFITSFGVLSGMFKRSPEPPQPGTVYRSPEIFFKLWPHIRSDNSSGLQISSLWSHRRSVKEEKMCANTTMGKPLGSAVPDGYLIVEANGGLNQQRSAICNAVAVAKLLNATLVIPRLEFHSVWKDPSVFGDIYDENYFIDTLKDYVTVVKELPSDLMERYNNNVLNIRNVKVKAGASANYYLKEVRPLLLKEGVIRIAPFANRLANSVPPDIQFVRCLANFQALRFAAPISRLAEEIVNRMSQNSSRTNGKYVAVHLRFEEDMVAFSCCVYDGGWIEDMEMDYARDKGWRNKFTQKDHVIDPGSNRLNGKCPLTPLEVGMMLRGMGFGNNTAMYIASGKIYRAKKNLAPLLQMFPLAQTKESLATKEELLLLKGYSSRLAALDYAVALQSEAFVATQGGNFAHFLRGHRQFLYGHAKTIKPDKKKLVLLLHNTSLSWEDFKEEMESMLAESDREGKMEPKIKKDKKRHPSIFEHPTRECICLRHHMN